MEDDPIPLTPNVSRDPRPKEETQKDNAIQEAGPSLRSQVKKQSKKRKAVDVLDGEAERVKKTVCSDGIASSTLQSTQYINDA